MVGAEHSETHVGHVPYVFWIREEGMKPCANHLEGCLHSFLERLHLLFVTDVLVLLVDLLSLFGRLCFSESTLLKSLILHLLNGQLLSEDLLIGLPLLLFTVVHQTG